MSDVTVGIPVYNNASTLERAVDSVLNQTWPVAQIVLSDDGSRDDSAGIAERLASRDPRIVFTRQPKNLGPAGNFRFVLQQASTPYFMWLAGDDVIEPGYVAATRARLMADPSLTTCVSHVLFTEPNGASGLALGSAPLLGKPEQNIARYLSDPADNARLYGLHRRDVLLKSFQVGDFVVAWDWALMAATLTYGGHDRVAETLMVRDRTSWESYMHLIRRFAGSRSSRIFPLLPMTRELLRRKDFPKTRAVMAALLHANLALHVDYMRQFHPGYDRVSSILKTFVLWRLKTT